MFEHIYYSIVVPFLFLSLYARLHSFSLTLSLFYMSVFFPSVEVNPVFSAVPTKQNAFHKISNSSVMQSDLPLYNTSYIIMLLFFFL